MSVCLRYVNKKEELAEVVNDGFLKIFKELYHLNTSLETLIPGFTAWLKRIMINTAIDHYRKNKNQALFSELGEQHEEVYGQAENGLDKLSHKEILNAVQTLPPGYRIVFNLYVIEGMKHTDIASLLNIAEGTSKSNLAKARVFLQKILIPYTI